MSRRTFGRRLRAARLALGLTQEDAARRGRVSAKYLSQVENEHASPSIAVVIRIVEDGLGSTMSEFFADEPAAKDELAKIHAILSGQPAAVRRRAVRLIRALVDE